MLKQVGPGRRTVLQQHQRRTCYALHQYPGVKRIKERVLDLVKKIVFDILTKAQDLRRLIDEAKDKEKLPAQYLVLQAEIEILMSELETLGCFYKDWQFNIGLVDFPAMIDGKEVLLCWRSDEPAIKWYHGVEDGYAGRVLIPENLL